MSITFQSNRNNIKITNIFVQRVHPIPIPLWYLPRIYWNADIVRLNWIKNSLCNRRALKSIKPIALRIVFGFEKFRSFSMAQRRYFLIFLPMRCTRRIFSIVHFLPWSLIMELRSLRAFVHQSRKNETQITLFVLFPFVCFRYAMDLKPGTYLIAPNIKNVSCTHPRYIHPLYHYIGPFDVVQALIILSITIGIIGANLMLIFVINHRRYSPYIHPLVNML